MGVLCRHAAPAEQAGTGFVSPVTEKGVEFFGTDVRDVVQAVFFRGHVDPLTVSRKGLKTCVADDVSAVLSRTGAEAYSCVKVALDLRRQDFRNRGLGTQDHMDFRRSADLREALDGGFYPAALRKVQIGPLVDDYIYIGAAVGLGVAALHLGVSGVADPLG